MGRDRNDSLDGVRALAAMSVLLFHARVPGFQNGGLGVQVFFALSGYLISSLIAREVTETGKIDIARFMLRRARRLVPALLIVVAFVFVLTPILFPIWKPLNAISAVLALTYSMNLGVSMGMPWTPLGHTWTLAIEMQFYLLWPAILGLFLNSKRPALLISLAWIAVLAARLALGSRLAVFDQTQLRCIECLLLGSLVAFTPPGRPILAAVGGVALLLIMFTPGAIGEALLALPLAAIASAMLVSGLRAPSALASALSWRPLAYMGLISYGIYLWQSPVTRVFAPYGWRLDAALSVAVSTALASLSYFTVERWARIPFRFKPTVAVRVAP